VGVGSTFSITLPLKLMVAPVVAEEAAVAEQQEPVGVS
jgi:hypothetical protein